MKEQEILRILDENARTSDGDIAKMLNISEAEVKRTIKSLEKKGVIAGYHAIINQEKLDENQCTALIEVNSIPQREHGYDKVAMMIAQYPEVRSVYLISGHSEFLIRVVGKSIQDIADFVGSKLAPMDGIKGTSTIFVLKMYKRDGVILKKHDEEKQKRQLASL